MITKNYKAFIKTVMLAGSSIVSLLPIKNYSGDNYYLLPTFSSHYPNTADYNLRLSAGYYGIHVGSGTTPPTENDYNLENQITSGLSGTSTFSYGIDNDGNAYMHVVLVIRNTSNADITISEIGSFQVVRASSSQFSTGSASNQYVMFDRSLLPQPVTIAPGDYATIQYTFKTTEVV